MRVKLARQLDKQRLRETFFKGLSKIFPNYIKRNVPTANCDKLFFHWKVFCPSAWLTSPRCLFPVFMLMLNRIRFAISLNLSIRFNSCPFSNFGQEGNPLYVFNRFAWCLEVASRSVLLSYAGVRSGRSSGNSGHLGAGDGGLQDRVEQRRILVGILVPSSFT